MKSGRGREGKWVSQLWRFRSYEVTLIRETPAVAHSSTECSCNRVKERTSPLGSESAPNRLVNRFGFSIAADREQMSLKRE